MTLWSLITNLADVIKYVREYYYFWTRKCSLFQTLFLSSDTPCSTCSLADVVKKIARGTRTPRAAESAFSFFPVTISYMYLTALCSLSGRWTGTRKKVTGWKLKKFSFPTSILYLFKKAFNYPEHVGFAIGKADSPKVVVLEIHYDNPRNLEGNGNSHVFSLIKSSLVKTSSYAKPCATLFVENSLAEKCSFKGSQ